MVLVRTTLGSEAAARALARRLVEAGKACCVHVSGIESFYRWEGRTEEAAEWLVEARAPAPLVDALRDAMLADHPYGTPLVEVVGETTVPPAYAAWAERVTR